MSAEQNNTPATEETQGGLNRRDILVGAGALGLGALVAAAVNYLRRFIPFQTVAEQSGHHGYPYEYEWAMVIDLNACIGCDYCVDACQNINDVADDMQWNVRVTDVTETGKTFHLTRNCLQCKEAPCVTVCPVKATYNRDIDGLVVMDYDKCIGCRYCQVACPYDARSFNWRDRADTPNDNSAIQFFRIDDEVTAVGQFGVPEVERRIRGVVEKCTFCIHRIDMAYERGLMPGSDPSVTPACVVACPVEARFFGDLKDPNSIVSQKLAENPTVRLREELGTENSVYYIPPTGSA